MCDVLMPVSDYSKSLLGDSLSLTRLMTGCLAGDAVAQEARVCSMLAWCAVGTETITDTLSAIGQPNTRFPPIQGWPMPAYGRVKGHRHTK